MKFYFLVCWKLDGNMTDTSQSRYKATVYGNISDVNKLLIIKHYTMTTMLYWILNDTNLYIPRMPSSWAILFKADSVLLYGTTPGLIPWVYSDKGNKLIIQNIYMYWW